MVNIEKFLKDYQKLIDTKNEINLKMAEDIAKQKRMGEQIVASYHLNDNVKNELLATLENDVVRDYNEKHDFETLYNDIKFYEQYIIEEETIEEENVSNPLN